MPFTIHESAIARNLQNSVNLPASCRVSCSSVRRRAAGTTVTIPAMVISMMSLRSSSKRECLQRGRYALQQVDLAALNPASGRILRW